uniref:hypothetical protein n=1 Tax=Shewanella sp. TaxID=50422 RepID=UPI0026337307
MLAQPFCFVSLQSGINEFNSLILLVVIDFDFILTPWNSGCYFLNKKDRRSGNAVHLRVNGIFIWSNWVLVFAHFKHSWISPFPFTIQLKLPCIAFYI